MRMRFRRLLALACLLASLVALAAAQARDGRFLVFVGTYTGKLSEGIYAFRFNPVTGESSSVGLAAATDNPSFLEVVPKGRFLYAVNELRTFRGEPTGAVSVFAVDPLPGTLRLLQQVSSLGADPAHLSLDRSARFLLVANYSGGNYAVFPIGPDGRLGPHSSLVQDAGSSVNPQRQAGPHAHFIQTANDNRFALVADLGLDQVLVHRFDAKSGSLTPGDPGFAKLDPGAGPRHLAFAPSGRFVYVVNELSSTVTVFAYRTDSGTLSSRQTISTLPGGFRGENTTAEITVDAKGLFLYVSNRGHDSIAVFSVDPRSGTLTLVEAVSTGGRTPRHFAIDPTGRWLLAANQNSNDIAVFRVDPGSGRLTLTSRPVKVGSPVCVRFVPVG
jgi:6-phosphogluconolactonase